MTLQTKVDPLDLQIMKDDLGTPCLQMSKSEAQEMFDDLPTDCNDAMDILTNLLDDALATIDKDGDVKYILLRINH